MNFTFYSCANVLPIEHNGPFILILLFLVVACIIYSVIGWLRKHNVWILSLTAMLGLWFIAGVGLYIIEPESFLSDWISSAAAIGTVGAVITSLYLSNRKTPRKDYLELVYLKLRIFENNSISIEFQLQNNSPVDIVINEFSIILNSLPVVKFEMDKPVCAHKILKFNPYTYDINGGALYPPSKRCEDLLKMSTKVAYFTIDTDVYHFSFRPKKIISERIRPRIGEERIVSGGQLRLTF